MRTIEICTITSENRCLSLYEHLEKVIIITLALTIMPFKCRMMSASSLYKKSYAYLYIAVIMNSPLTFDDVGRPTCHTYKVRGLVLVTALLSDSSTNPA